MNSNFCKYIIFGGGVGAALGVAFGKVLGYFEMGLLGGIIIGSGVGMIIYYYYGERNNE